MKDLFEHYTEQPKKLNKITFTKKELKEFFNKEY